MYVHLTAFITCADVDADRMFTSRSEYRVSIRADNADTRLTEKARLVGAVRESRWRAFTTFREQLAEGGRLLQEFSQTPQGWAKLGLAINKDGIARR
jgi:tRNA uridine 5-carboxymethylaminomethyl modification enzyme